LKEANLDKMKSGFLRFHIGILLAATFLFGCNNKGPGYFQGYVEGEYLYIAASAKGELIKLAVTKGQTVNQGEPLFQLDPNPEVLEIEELNQRIQQAESKLADVGKGSRPSELEAIVARLNKSKMVWNSRSGIINDARNYMMRASQMPSPKKSSIGTKPR
jgi:multidrug resistance efflux pump